MQSEYMLMLRLTEHAAVVVRNALLKAAVEETRASEQWYSKGRLSAEHQRRAVLLETAADAIVPICRATL